jgi:putative transposase
VFRLPHAAPHVCDSGATQGITNDSFDSITFWIGSKVAVWVIDYNGERPHSSLKYQTPAAYAATFTATDDRLRNPDQLRQSPVAPPAPQGVQKPETLTVAG